MAKKIRWKLKHLSHIRCLLEMTCWGDEQQLTVKATPLLSDWQLLTELEAQVTGLQHGMHALQPYGG